MGVMKSMMQTKKDEKGTKNKGALDDIDILFCNLITL